MDGPCTASAGARSVAQQPCPQLALERGDLRGPSTPKPFSDSTITMTPFQTAGRLPQPRVSPALREQRPPPCVPQPGRAAQDSPEPAAPRRSEARPPPGSLPPPSGRCPLRPRSARARRPQQWRWRPSPKTCGTSGPACSAPSSRCAPPGPWPSPRPARAALSGLSPLPALPGPVPPRSGLPPPPLPPAGPRGSLRDAVAVLGVLSGSVVPRADPRAVRVRRLRQLRCLPADEGQPRDGLRLHQLLLRWVRGRDGPRGGSGRCRSPDGLLSRRIIAMMSPEDSWVSKWQRISECRWLFCPEPFSHSDRERGNGFKPKEGRTRV